MFRLVSTIVIQPPEEVLSSQLKSADFWQPVADVVVRSVWQ